MTGGRVQCAIEPSFWTHLGQTPAPGSPRCRAAMPRSTPQNERYSWRRRPSPVRRLATAGPGTVALTTPDMPIAGGGGDGDGAMYAPFTHPIRPWVATNSTRLSIGGLGA